MHPNLKAFLDTIAVSELGAKLISLSDNGYNVVVGSTPDKPILFHSYTDHPRQLVHLSPTLASTAAGRYQILARYFDVYKTQLKLPDFGHDSQDKIATQMITECHALSDVLAGNVASALTKCNSRWASLPGSSYGQHTNGTGTLVSAYQSAGGTLA